MSTETPFPLISAGAIFKIRWDERDLTCLKIASGGAIVLSDGGPYFHRGSFGNAKVDWICKPSYRPQEQGVELNRHRAMSYGDIAMWASNASAQRPVMCVNRGGPSPDAYVDIATGEPVTLFESGQKTMVWSRWEAIDPAGNVVWSHPPDK